jgi:hypothetical protein
VAKKRQAEVISRKSYETFKIDCVLIDVYAAPPSRRHGRIAHGVIDQEICKIIGDARVAARCEALEHHGIEAVLHDFRSRDDEDGLTRDSHMHSGKILVCVESGAQLTLRDRMIFAVRHIFFARPQQFYWRSRKLLRYQHGLFDVIDKTPAAEAAPLA